MKPNLIIALVLAAVGVVLLVMGLNATESFGERVTEGVTGHYSDKTTWFIIGGIACLAVSVGSGLLSLRKRG